MTNLMDSFAFAFCSPETRKRILEQDRQRLKQACKAAVAWDEDKTKFQKLLALQGRTFNTSKYQWFEAKPTQLTGEKLLDAPDLVWSPNRNFVYVNRILPRYHALELFQGHQRGRVVFNTNVVTPVLMRYNRGHYEPFQTWMGITPAEILSQRQGVRQATGHVLIGGLGLGWLLWKVAEKKTVQKITLVEISQELLDWGGYELCERVRQATGKPVEVICDDVLNHMGKHGAEVRHLIDIWPSYPNYRNDLPGPWKDVLKTVEHFWGWGVLSDPEDYF